MKLLIYRETRQPVSISKMRQETPPKEQPKILSNVFSEVVNSKSNSNCKQIF